MRCEEAACLISARIDGEVTPQQRSELEAHLAGCADCRAVDAAVKAQDIQLRRAFDRRRAAAGRVAFQTISRVRQNAPAPRSMIWWPQVVGAMAAGFVLAVLLFQPWDRPNAPSRAMTAQIDAQLMLATGPVEIREAGGTEWQWVSGPAPIHRGARIRTPEDVRCELRTRAGVTLRLNADSEVVLRDANRAELIRGQVWSNTVAARRPLRLVVSGTTIVAPEAELDTRREGTEIVLTAVSGAPEVYGKGGNVILADGEAVRVVGGEIDERWCEHDAVFATRWVHDLLRLRRASSLEFDRRIDALVAGIDSDEQAVDPYEREIRTFGGDSAEPLARFLQSECSADPDRAEPQPTRTAAARILADLAPPHVIPDLIELLSCGDREVRYHAARALERLTAVDQGLPTMEWRESPCDPCAQTTESWRRWWEQNRTLFAGNS